MLGLRSNPISAVITLICSLLSLVTACLYRMWFVGSTEFNQAAFLCLIIASVLGVFAFLGGGYFILTTFIYITNQNVLEKMAKLVFLKPQQVK